MGSIAPVRVQVIALAWVSIAEEALMRAVSAVVDRRYAGWVVAQERPSISRYGGRSCCTDVRSGAWAVAADRPRAREIVRFLTRFAAPRRQLKRRPFGGNSSVRVFDECPAQCYSPLIPSTLERFPIPCWPSWSPVSSQGGCHEGI